MVQAPSKWGGGGGIHGLPCVQRCWAACRAREAEAVGRRRRGVLRVPGWVRCCRDDALLCPYPARAGRGVNPVGNSHLFVGPWCLIAAVEVSMPLSHTGPLCHIISVYSQVLSQGTEPMPGAFCYGCGPGCCSSALVMGAPGFLTGSLCFAKSLFQYNSSCALVGSCVECSCAVRKLRIKTALTLGGCSEDRWISFG